MAAPLLGFGDRRTVLHVAAPLLTPANGARGVRLLCVLADTCCSLLFSREHGGSRGGFDVAPTLTEKLKQNRTAISGDAHGPRWPAFPLRVRCPQNETCVPPEAGRTGRGSPHQTRPSAPRPRPPRRQPPLSSQVASLARRSPRAVWCCWEASLSRGGERCRRGLLRGESGRTGRARAQR